MANLSQKSVHAIKWNFVGTIARFALQLISQVILSRILGPKSYGIFGLGMIVYTFGNFFSNFGFGRQLLQMQKINDFDIRFAFTWQVMLGAFATISIYLYAAEIAEYFNSDELVGVIQWLSFACVINAATSPASNLLARELNYKIIARIQFLSYFLGYIAVGIPLAYCGVGVFSLVYAWLLQLIITFFLTYIAHPHTLKPLFWYKDGKDALSYGGTVFISNIVNWILSNIDRIFVGRFLSLHTVGLYTVSYNLATLPNNLLLNGLQTIFLTSGAKTVGQFAKLRESYIQVVSTILVLIVPVFVTLSLISPLLIKLLYGEKWLGAGDILAVMFLAIPAMVCWGLSTPILWNLEKKNQEALMQIPVLFIGGLFLYIFASSGAIVVAWIFVAIAFSRAAVMFFCAALSLNIKFRVFLPSVLRSLLFSLIFYDLTKFSMLLAQSIGSIVFELIVTLIVVSTIGIWIIWHHSDWLGQHPLGMLARFSTRFKR